MACMKLMHNFASTLVRVMANREAITVLRRNIHKIKSPLVLSVAYEDEHTETIYDFEPAGTDTYDNCIRDIATSDKEVFYLAVMVNQGSFGSFLGGFLYMKESSLSTPFDKPLYSTYDWSIDERRLRQLFGASECWVYADQVANEDIIDLRLVHTGGPPHDRNSRSVEDVSVHKIKMLLSAQYPGIRFVSRGTDPHRPDLRNVLPVPSAAMGNDSRIATYSRNDGTRNVSIRVPTHDVFPYMNAALRNLNRMPLSAKQKRNAAPRVASAAWLSLYGGPRYLNVLREGAGTRRYARLPNAKRALNLLGIPSDHIEVAERTSRLGGAAPADFQGRFTNANTGSVFYQVGRSAGGRAVVSPPSWHRGARRSGVAHRRLFLQPQDDR